MFSDKMDMERFLLNVLKRMQGVSLPRGSPGIPGASSFLLPSLGGLNPQAPNAKRRCLHQDDKTRIPPKDAKQRSQTKIQNKDPTRQILLRNIPNKRILLKHSKRTVSIEMPYSKTPHVDHTRKIPSEMSQNNNSEMGKHTGTNPNERAHTKVPKRQVPSILSLCETAQGERSQTSTPRQRTLPKHFQIQIPNDIFQ